MAEKIQASASLAHLVNDRPQLAGLFETLRLDYCCGGEQSLVDACAERGLDVNTVLEMLEALDRVGAGAAAADRNWREAGLTELCDHITTVYHDGLRRDLPDLGALLDTVVRVHRAERPELVETEHAFVELRKQIEAHIDEEDQTLFPAICELESLSVRTVDPALIDRHESEHSEVGEGLKRLRELADDYDPDKALCSTHRLLYERLAAFEADMHQHVHKENNILFPRARELASTASGAGAGGA